METVICLLKKEEIHSQQVGTNYSFIVPGFGGPGNDLRIVLAPEAAAALVKDMEVITKAHSIERMSKVPHN